MLKLLFKLLYTATAFIETLVIFRIILNFINAETTNKLVSWVYNLSDYFVAPFKGITADTISINSFTIQLTPIVALVFYIVLAFIFSELIKSFSHGD